MRANKVLERVLKTIIPIRILLALKAGSLTISGLIGAGIRAEAFYRYRDYLVEKKLVRQEKQKAFPFRVHLSLTDKGKNFCAKFEELMSFL